MKISYHDYSDQNDHVISIITVLLKCAGDVQKVPTPSFIFKNQQTTNKLLNNNKKNY